MSEISLSAFNLLQTQAKTIAEQLRDARQLASPHQLKLNDLPRVVWRTSRYVDSSEIDKKKTRSRRSWVAHHGFYLTQLDATGTRALKSYWICRRCDESHCPAFCEASSTSNAMAHLAKQHRVDEATPIYDAPDLIPDTTVLEQLVKAPKRSASLQLAVTFKRARLITDQAVGFVVNTDLPLGTFDDPFLRSLLKSFNPALEVDTSWSRGHIKKELLKLWGHAKTIVKQEIDSAQTAIHFSFDLWTSPNGLPFIAVFAHFLDRSFEYQSRLIAFRR